MICFDCNTRGLERPAVGICTECGAAVCQSCAALDSVTVPGPVTMGTPTVETTRAVACPSCEVALRLHRHPYPTGVAAGVPARD